jgi:hypothetical protein
MSATINDINFVAGLPTIKAHVFLRLRGGELLTNVKLLVVAKIKLVKPEIGTN